MVGGWCLDTRDEEQSGYLGGDGGLGEAHGLDDDGDDVVAALRVVDREAHRRSQQPTRHSEPSQQI